MSKTITGQNPIHTALFVAFILKYWTYHICSNHKNQHSVPSYPNFPIYLHMTSFQHQVHQNATQNQNKLLRCAIQRIIKPYNVHQSLNDLFYSTTTHLASSVSMPANKHSLICNHLHTNKQPYCIEIKYHQQACPTQTQNIMQSYS